MTGEITLEIKIKANDNNLNNCHSYCDYITTVPHTRGVLCRLFRTDGYLDADWRRPSVEFKRCASCIEAQVGVKTQKEDTCPTA